MTNYQKLIKTFKSCQFHHRIIDGLILKNAINDVKQNDVENISLMFRKDRGQDGSWFLM